MKIQLLQTRKNQSIATKFNRTYSSNSEQQMNINNFYHILTLSVPLKSSTKPRFWSSVVSNIYTENLRFDHGLTLRMSNIELKNLVFVTVSDKYSGATRRNFTDDDLGVTLTFIEFSVSSFFNTKRFYSFFEEYKSKNFEVVFIFENLSWKEICGKFASVYVDISGGSNNKKHILSTLQFRLSQILFCIYGSNASEYVSYSFHKSRTNRDIKEIDYTLSNIQEFIVDFNEKRTINKQEITSERSIDTVTNSDSQIVDSKLVDFLNKSNDNENNNYEIPFNDNNPSENLNNNYNNRNIRENFPRSIKKFHTSSRRLNLEKPIKIVAPKPVQIEKKNNDSKIGDYLESIKQLIEETKDFNEEQKREIQFKIEDKWINLIEDKLNDDKFLINNYQNLLYSNFKEAELTLNSMCENNYLKRKFPKLGNELNKLEFLVLTFSLSLSLYSWASYNYIAIKVGKEIIYLNYKFKYLRKKKSSETKPEKSFDEYKNDLNVDSKFYLILGDFFLNIFQRFPHEIFIRKINISSYFDKEPFTLEINKEHLDEIKNNIIIEPTALPMICKPNEWSDSKFGGFLFNENKQDDIITYSSEYGHSIKNRESIYKSVNYLNSIKFGINNKLLNYLQSSEGSYILDEIKAENELQRSITLNIANIYNNIYFYLNTQSDWRGRIYTQSFYLSYQAGDLSTSLLDFWEGSSLNEKGKIYFYIYGVNNHNENGISKSSYSERLEWVKKNYDKIINLDKNLILSAENPFVFTSFCLNMRDLHNDPNTIIKTPIFLDATCSGIQHLAGLMKDLELGVQTNLIESSYNAKPGDIYSNLLEPINSAINKFGENNLEYIELSQVKLTRKEVKTSIMTKVYNVTTYGISQQLQSKFKTIFNNDDNNDNNQINSNNFEEYFHDKPINILEKELEESFKNDRNKSKFICPGKNGHDIILTKKDIYKIAEIINDQIFVCFPSLNYIYNYFIDIAKLSTKLGIPLTWITPAGLEITQHYLKRKKKVVPISLFGKIRKLVIRENDVKKMDNAKQTQAIIPNIIHSLDATHLNNLIKTVAEKNFKPVITIHDCFGTLPNQMGELEFMVKKEFILLYSDNSFLNNFHNRFLQSITDNQFKIKTENEKSFVVLSPSSMLEIPSIPELGQLDIENIINSNYMIS